MPNIDKIQVKYGKKLYKIMDVILSEKTGKEKNRRPKGRRWGFAVF